MEVLFLDNHILVVAKPQNMPMNGENGFIENVKAYLSEKGQKATYLEPVFPMDTLAGGLMLFALTSKAKERLEQQLLETDLQVKYFTVVVGENKNKNDLVTFYTHINKQTNLLEHIPQLNQDAIKLQVKYNTLQREQQIALLQCVPSCAHSQEIRFALQAVNMPIFGDASFKGDVLAKNTNTALWAVELKFMHPTTKKFVTFRCFPPTGKPWSYFNVERLLKI
ncbi:MAG: hypothetical protein IJZ26_03290 [Clostridia bacterium]|nr:hypothetical protein [Clostridia bacterium]